MTSTPVGQSRIQQMQALLAKQAPAPAKPPVQVQANGGVQKLATALVNKAVPAAPVINRTGKTVKLNTVKVKDQGAAFFKDGLPGGIAEELKHNASPIVRGINNFPETKLGNGSSASTEGDLALARSLQQEENVSVKEEKKQLPEFDYDAYIRAEAEKLGFKYNTTIKMYMNSATDEMLDKEGMEKIILS